MKPRTHTPEFKADAIARFHEAKKNGISIMALAKELGITDSLLHNWARGKKTKPKKKKTAALAKGSPQTRYSDAVKGQALALVDSGVGQSQAARQLKLTPQVVSFWVKKRGKSPSSEPGATGAIRDAIAYLVHAEKKIMDMVRDGKINKPDPAHLLALLALGVLLEARGK